ncbi:recombinase family protein [Parafrankia sp. FMc2]|uniref:recombinase family protein n=1 Tax=Parafrankia sp. FMc2 TaxID=3233196 RepID=UPI0034D772F9
MAKLNGLRLGLYTRYSELVGGDDALERQDEDGYEFADEHGATIEKVYQEKKSAWKKKTIVLEDGTMISRVIRPDYAELLADLRSGFLDGAIVWDLDRLTRDLRDLEDAIEVVELYGRPIVGPGVGPDHRVREGERPRAGGRGEQSQRGHLPPGPPVPQAARRTRSAGRGQPSVRVEGRQTHVGSHRSRNPARRGPQDPRRGAGH